MELIYYFEKCCECNKDILISIALIGVNHNASIKFVCKDCLKKKGLDKEFKKQSPKDAEMIEKWLSE